MGRFEINDCTFHLMLVLLKDLIGHQLEKKGLKEDFNQRLKFLPIAYFCDSTAEYDPTVISHYSLPITYIF